MTDLGLALSSRAGFPAPAYGAYARAAEEAGFSAVFATETASDSLALAHAMVAHTQRLLLGTAIANLHLRHPALMAMTAQALDDDSGGRFVLGLGTASDRLNRDVLGLDPAGDLASVDEYIDVLRLAFTGQTIDYSGHVFTVRGLDLYRPPKRTVPIYLGALLPRMLALAGRAADGVILHLTSPTGAAASIEAVRQASEAAGRAAGEVTIACMLPCYVSDDTASAVEAARETVLRYALHPAASKVFARSGHAGTLAAVAEKLRDGERDEALALVDEDLARSFVVHGSSHACRHQVQSYRDAGVQLPILFPMADRSGDWDASVNRTIDAFIRASAS